jgi:hypothetical protein
MADRILACFLLVASILIPSAASAQALQGDWVDAEVQPCMPVGATQVCVDVKRQDIPGSPLFAFRGEAELDLPVGVMAAVLLDDTIGTEWVDLMNLSEEKRRIGPHAKILHQGYDLPFPVKDRDYSLLEEAEFDSQAKVFTLQFKSVVDEAVPEVPGYIRAEAITTYWRLSAIPGSDKVKVEVEVFTDPKGTLPPWLVNLIQRTWPRNTIVGLYRRSIQGDIPGHPEAAGW